MTDQMKRDLTVDDPDMADGPSLGDDDDPEDEPESPKSDPVPEGDA